MRLNRLEFLAMNNPLRRLHLRFVELAIFKKFVQRHEIDLRETRMLDAACGSGYSTKLLQKYFNPQFIAGFDIMPEQTRLALRDNIAGHYCLADITRLPFKSQSIDAVFAFGILHHIEDWQSGLAELSRVLMPDGYLFVEEPNKAAVEFFGKYAGFEFPRDNRFGWKDLESAWRQNGFTIINSHKIYVDTLRAYLLQKR